MMANVECLKQLLLGAFVVVLTTDDHIEDLRTVGLAPEAVRAAQHLGLQRLAQPDAVSEQEARAALGQIAVLQRMRTRAIAASDSLASSSRLR